jgi:hypothetical protein
MDTTTTTSGTATTTSSTVGIAIIRILPRREAACSAPRQHGTIDGALQKRAIAFAIEQPPDVDVNEIVVRRTTRA